MTGHQGLSKSGRQSANAGWSLLIGFAMVSSSVRMAIVMAVMVLRPFELRRTSRARCTGKSADADVRFLVLDADAPALDGLPLYQA